MKATKLTSRYAKSLLSLVIENNSLESTLSDMKLILSVCNQNRDLSQLLKSPVVKTDKKLTILSEIFSKEVTEITMAFISIITNKKREKFLEGIAESFISLYKIHNNIETVTLKPPSDTRWKSRVEALRPLRYQLGQIYDALVEIEDVSLTRPLGTTTRCQVKGLDQAISKFKFILTLVT